MRRILGSKFVPFAAMICAMGSTASAPAQSTPPNSVAAEQHGPMCTTIDAPLATPVPVTEQSLAALDIAEAATPLGPAIENRMKEKNKPALEPPVTVELPPLDAIVRQHRYLEALKVHEGEWAKLSNAAGDAARAALKKQMVDEEGSP